MADGGLDSRSDLPAKLVEKVTEKASEKRCTVCQVPVKQHVGKHGPGNCLGSAFSAVFRDLLAEVKALRLSLEDERREARDREFRLQKKISDLAAKLEASSTAVEQLTKETAALKESLCVQLTKFTDWADDSERSGKKGMRKPRRPKHANADSSPTSVESDSRLPPCLVPESDDNKDDGKDNAKEEARDKDVEDGWMLAGTRRRQQSCVTLAPSAKAAKSRFLPPSADCRELISEADGD